jgi:hypothetical protein
MDILEELEIGYPLLVVCYDVIILNFCESVAVLKIVVGVLAKSLILSHPYSGEVVSVAMVIVGHLIVGRE